MSAPSWDCRDAFFQRLKGKRWYKVPEAITWTGFSLILQGEQYQRQLCGKVVPMRMEHRRPPAFPACHPCSEGRPAAVWFGSGQHKWRNLIISFSRRNSDAYPVLLCAAFANELQPSALAGFDKKCGNEASCQLLLQMKTVEFVLFLELLNLIELLFSGSATFPPHLTYNYFW